MVLPLARPDAARFLNFLYFIKEERRNIEYRLMLGAA
jgi:hypothetical protein